MSQELVVVTFRVKTQNVIIVQNSNENELPIRRWQIEIVMLDQYGNEVEANILSSCKYRLHASFHDPIRSIEGPPFTLQEKGWGGFPLKIVCYLKHKAGNFKINHDLHFDDNAYAMDYTMELPYDIPDLRADLTQYYDIPDVMDSFPDFTNGKYNWKELVRLDEDEITDFVQIILKNQVVQTEIEKYDRKEPFYMFMGQLPQDLLDQLKEYLVAKVHHEKK